MKWDARARSKFSIELPAGEAFVYVAWGIDDSRALYVGKTRHLMARMGQHERSSDWYPYLDRLDVYAYRSDSDALKAEAEAIWELHPEYNTMLNGFRPDPIARHPRHPRRPEPRVTFGDRWASLDDIPADQLVIVRRVQRRGKHGDVPHTGSLEE